MMSGSANHPLTVTSRAVTGGYVVDASGDIDMSSSPRMREELRKLVAQKPGKIVVSLKDVSYIDSSGLATLVECLQSTNKLGSQLMLIGMNDSVKDIFELSGLDRVFAIKASESEALAS